MEHDGRGGIEARDWGSLALELARDGDRRAEADFEAHERLTNPNGLSLHDMMETIKDDQAVMADVLSARIGELVSKGELTAEMGRRYAVHASRGLLPPKTAARVADKTLMFQKYPAVESRYEAASDTVSHRASLEEGLRRRGSVSGLKLGIEGGFLVPGGVQDQLYHLRRGSFHHIDGFLLSLRPLRTAARIA